MPLLQTRGAGSAKGLGLTASAADVNYIEDVFSTYLYNGTSTTNPINNGIDLSTKGGLVWGKRRNLGNSHFLIDTARGVGNRLESDGTGAQTDKSTSFTSFNSNGFTVATGDAEFNNSAGTYCSWTFRKQPKFFDIVTYTGNSTARTIAHNLGSVPGCIIIKGTTGPASTQNWEVYHRSTGNTQALFLDLTQAPDVGSQHWNNTSPTSTEFTLGAGAGVNNNTTTYVAYLFAHDAGGFGLTGTDNVISCGSYTGTGADQSISVGFEPQWLLIKKSSGSVGDWAMFDNMRGAPVLEVADSFLKANGSNAEYNAEDFVEFYADGFKVDSAQSSINGSGHSHVYVAIRRGPMKVPTDATKVFVPVVRTGTDAAAAITGIGFPPSLIIVKDKNNGYSPTFVDRMRGSTKLLRSSSTAIEDSTLQGVTSFNMDGISIGNGTSGGGFINTSPNSIVNWLFQRAPSFFDEVCYTGTGSARTVTHNLAAVPELMIIKSRTDTWNWAVYHSALGNTKFTLLDSTGGPVTQSTVWNDTSPTSSVFTVGSAGYTNASAGNYVAYLFATCAGVSKVGSYTGTGATLQIDCSFTGGARFVLIKRSQDGFSGDWYVWDSARGIVAGNDPYLLLNSTAAEVANTDYIDTYSAGFELSSTAPDALNASGGSYIFLAIA
jgi:hypothetical protein